MLDAIPGFKDYATKFVQGDLVELSLVAGMPDFVVSLKVRPAIGPALEKIQQRKGLILDGLERASATVVRKHALLIVRHLFARVVETMRSGSGRAAQLLVKILQARSTHFPHRQEDRARQRPPPGWGKAPGRLDPPTSTLANGRPGSSLCAN